MISEVNGSSPVFKPSIEIPNQSTQIPNQSNDEKVANVATASIGALKPEGVVLKSIQNRMSQVNKGTKAHKFKEIVLQCLQEEGLQESAKAKALFEEKQVKRVVQKVFRKIFENVFPQGSILVRYLQFCLRTTLLNYFKISSIPFDKQLEIFKMFLDTQKEESDESVDIEIAMACAQQSGKNTAQNIQHFGIKKEDGLIEIAMACAQQDGDMAEYIQNFGINNEDALIKIAMVCAQQSGKNTAQYIRNFDINNEKALIKIAMACAQRSDWKTAQYIQNFGINNEDALIKIAMACVRQSGENTAKYIRYFDIKKEAGLIEIAIACVQRSGRKVVSYIQNFGINNEDALKKIAKMSEERDVFKRREKIFRS